MGRFSFLQFQGTVYRATSYDTPLWVLPNRRSGRWNDPVDETIVQYCTLDAAAPLAEFVRHEDLREAADAAEARLSVWQLRLAEGAIVDLSSPERATAQEVDWDALVADDWKACQELGREIAAAGGRGILGPCAALPGSLSLTIFGPRSEIRWTAEPRLAIQIPARKIMHGAPGAGIVAGTRFFGMPYPDGVATPAVGHLLDR
ncbi:MAG TPA: RES family NAD+ phosphorylase [Thermoleophilaceae bacterium]|nr:RES family NAD+ phosphorylase [Thermoleophilaceae bacterium]